MKTIIPSDLAALLHPFLPQDAYLSADQPASDSPTRTQRLASVGKIAIGVILAMLFFAVVVAEILACGAGVYCAVTERLTIFPYPTQIALSLIASIPVTLFFIGLNWAVLIGGGSDRSILPNFLCGFGLAGIVLDGLIFTLLLSITISG